MIEFVKIREDMGPWGQWSVGNATFYEKRQALLYASETNTESVIYRWYNSVWENFNRASLGTVKLESLYALRAQQLRDNYDYLTLNYSGGADSHNILMTFLHNKIHLDEVFVNWPMVTVGNNKVYIPNTVDDSASNILSEWDFCITPTLKYLSQYHPEIKITVGDWSKNLSEDFYTDEVFQKASTYWGAGSLFRNQNESTASVRQSDSGQRVAGIYGFDKPNLHVHDDNRTVSMFFHDSAFQTATNTTGIFEPFYWSPDLPDLAYEMAYQVFLYFDCNPLLRKFIYPRGKMTDIIRETSIKINNDICRNICYPKTWNPTTFQSGKPSDGIRTDRDFWIYKFPDFSRLVESWRYHYDGFLKNIDSRFFNKKGGLLPLRTKLFYIGTFANDNDQHLS
jgi:hypothetical protein